MAEYGVTLAQLINLTEEVGADVRARIHDSLREVILELIADSKANPTERAALGYSLAALHDARGGVGVTAGANEAGTPDIAWIEISAGEFIMGSDPVVDAEAKEREQPRHVVSLPSYKIARYPVTVAQYEQFVQQRGYLSPDYWSEKGLSWKGEREQPEIGWLDPLYHVPNQPVIGVTWFEAQAYCRWLSKQLGFLVRLPTEAEWEKAARGTDGRLYPYGNEIDETRFNGEWAQIGSPCAVGLFPHNHSPYGVLDMCGNVFEWTSSLFRDYPYNAADGREDPNRSGSRIFRGGAFNTPAALARCAFRSHFYPHGCYDWVGFRLCMGG